MAKSKTAAASLGGEELARASRVLQAMAHPIRLAVIQCLREGEMSVGELQAAIGCSQSLMSQQLRILEEHRLILMQRDGKRKLCRIRNPDFLQLFQCMKKHLQTFYKLEGSL